MRSYRKWCSTWLAGAILIAAGGALLAQSGQRQEDAFDYYRKWLDEDVGYIITPEELAIFKELSTPEERDQFIEQFWRRRDPDPTTAINEFKEEHYRRIAYANEKFHSGVPGWRTDRGMIYIRFGPPTGTEKMPEGGHYARKRSEGGGFTAVYPFEVWFYNRIPGVGDGIEIEFVDPSRTNEYHIARDREEKDALITVPGAGLTDAEAFGSHTRFDRLRARGLANPDPFIDPTFQALSIRDYPLQRLETLYKLQKVATTEFNDLQKVVAARVSYEQLPLATRIDYLMVSDVLALVPVTVFFRDRDLTFEKLESGASRALVDVYGQIQTIGGRLEYAFEETIKRDTSEVSSDGVSVFQRRIPLAPGRYKLSLVARDTNSGRIGNLEKLVHVPQHPETDLFCSTPILTSRVEATPSGDIGESFVLGKYKVQPLGDNEFVPEDVYAQTYFEVYNLTYSQDTLAPDVQVEIALFRGGDEVFPFVAMESEFEFVRDRLLVFKTIPFRGLAPGNYKLRFRITDRIADKQVENGVEFVMKGTSASE